MGSIFGMYHVYILRSEKNGRYYIGCTNALARRLLQHSEGKVFSIKYIRPIELVYTEAYEEGTEARKREYWLKSQKSRKILETLIAASKGERA